MITLNTSSVSPTFVEKHPKSYATGALLGLSFILFIFYLLKAKSQEEKLIFKHKVNYEDKQLAPKVNLLKTRILNAVSENAVSEKTTIYSQIIFFSNGRHSFDPKAAQDKINKLCQTLFKKPIIFIYFIANQSESHQALCHLKKATKNRPYVFFAIWDTQSEKICFCTNTPNNQCNWYTFVKALLEHENQVQKSLGFFGSWSLMQK